MPWMSIWPSTALLLILSFIVISPLVCGIMAGVFQQVCIRQVFLHLKLFLPFFMQAASLAELDIKSQAACMVLEHLLLMLYPNGWKSKFRVRARYISSASNIGWMPAARSMWDSQQRAWKL